MAWEACHSSLVAPEHLGGQLCRENIYPQKNISQPIPN